MAQPSTSATRTDSPPPTKRPRPADMDAFSNANGGQSSSHAHTGTSALPPLSLSILGVEPLDEFIKEIADFVHHMIISESPNYPLGKIEVEAKVGVLRDRVSGRRLELPVLVETSTCPLPCRVFALYTTLLIAWRLWRRFVLNSSSSAKCNGPPVRI
jgi:hypothetical protein